MGHSDYSWGLPVQALKGQFFHAIDAKCRLTIPARLREVASPSEDGYGFVVALGFDKVLYLYTPKAYEQITPKFDRRAQTSPAVRKYQRLSYGMADRLELDGLNRVLIPEALLRRCEIEKDVAIIGCQDHIEIWPRKRWEEFLDTEMAHHDDLAGEAMAATEPQPAPAAAGQERGG